MIDACVLDSELLAGCVVTVLFAATQAPPRKPARIYPGSLVSAIYYIALWPAAVTVIYRSQIFLLY